MKGLVRSTLLLTLLLFLTVTIAVAQDGGKPVAFVRQNPDGSYFIKVKTNAKLPPGSKLTAILSNKDKLINWQDEVSSCPGKQDGKVCTEVDTTGHVELDFPLARSPQSGDKFKVSFAITDGAGHGSFNAIDLLADFKAGGPRLDGTCKDGLIVDLTYDSSTWEGPEAKYYGERFKVIDAWLKANKSSPQEIAKVQIETLKKSGVDEYKVQSFTVFPGIGGGTQAQDLDIDGALESPRVGICLRLARSLPSEKFNAQVSFTSPPMELAGTIKKSLTGPKALGQPIASNISEENKLGLRSFEDNLSLGVLFTSSVRETKIGKQTVRGRQNRGAMDLRFAPSLRGRMRPPEVRKWQPFWTPFFLDAKISTGPIASDTLSLNRILFGSELALRYYQSTERGKRNKYLLNMRAVNASDRDYKRAELDGAVEFRPIFDALNRPLRLRRRTEASVLMPDGPPKEIPYGSWFGYQIQPLIGFEVGKIYRTDRLPLKGEELGTGVRRLLFGGDVLLSLGPHVNISLTDTFYFRLNVQGGGHTRNYFDGVIEVPLGSISRNASQSIFFSFERGDQPPFSTPSVNALKFGYRVRSDFFAGGASK